MFHIEVLSAFIVHDVAYLNNPWLLPKNAGYTRESQKSWNYSGPPHALGRVARVEGFRVCHA